MTLFKSLLTAVMLLGAAVLLAQDSRRQATPEAEFHMARMVYSDGYGPRFGRSARGGGWWAIDYPQAEKHFTEGVRRLTRIEVADDSRHLSIMDDEIFDYPWLFVQQVGQGMWRPTAEEAARLRSYLLRGGFLVVDDFHGPRDWEIFASAIRKVFPDRPIVDLDSRDPVFQVHYELDQLTQIPGERHLYRARDGEIRAQLAGPQAWRGIYDDDGRLMVAINFNMDMGDAWEHADDAHYPEPMTALAYRFGINYVVYAMTH